MIAQISGARPPSLRALRATKTYKMVRHPIESNFYASVSDTEIEVTFAPTRSIYTFSRLPAESGEAISLNPSILHARTKGHTGEYEPAAV